MTTENDFQAALDACPEDWQTRLVFADWLQERGDVRAEGYRALGVLRRVPQDTSEKDEYVWMWSSESLESVDEHHLHVLPADWFRYLCKSHEMYGYGKRGLEAFELKWGEPRRAGEDKAAFAFAHLPGDRRAELLSLTS